MQLRSSRRLRIAPSPPPPKDILRLRRAEEVDRGTTRSGARFRKRVSNLEYYQLDFLHPDNVERRIRFRQYFILRHIKFQLKRMELDCQLATLCYPKLKSINRRDTKILLESMREQRNLHIQDLNFAAEYMPNSAVKEKMEEELMRAREILAFCYEQACQCLY
jgi:hypothetical protein